MDHLILGYQGFLVWLLGWKEKQRNADMTRKTSQKSLFSLAGTTFCSLFNWPGWSTWSSVSDVSSILVKPLYQAGSGRKLFFKSEFQKMCLVDSTRASWGKSGPPWALGLELEGPRALSWAFCRCCQILSSLYPMLWKRVLSLALDLILAQSNLIEAGSQDN